MRELDKTDRFRFPILLLELRFALRLGVMWTDRIENIGP